MLMLQKIRLQRKFTPKNKVTLASRVFQITKMMIFYELTLILLVCLLNLSFHFHLAHIFAVSFWSNEESINANLALSIATLLLIPYLIFIENTSVSLIKDLVATALILQILLGVVINGNLQIGFVVYMTVLGGMMMVLGNYGGILREQKSLIQEIRNIQNLDRHEQRLRQEEHECLTQGTLH